MESSIFDGRRTAMAVTSFGVRLTLLPLVVALLGTGSVRAEPPASAAAAKGARAGAASANPREEELRASARARLVEGVEFMRQGQYAAALTRFEQAYAIVPSPNIHYDRGLAYLGLGRNADALEAFEAFLAEADHPPPGTRERAARERVSLRAQVATLAITSDPPGADVTVDGRLRGVTPVGGSIYLDPGTHQVSARNRATGVVASQQIAALPGQTLSVTLLLGEGARSPEAPSGSAGAPAAVSSSDTGIRGASNVLPLSLAGVGIALLGAGTTFGILAQRESDSLSRDSKDGAWPGPGVIYVQSKQADGLRDQALQEIFLAAGAVAVTTGVVLYVVNRRKNHGNDSERSASSHAGLALSGAASVAPGRMGARLQLSF
jgi:hypothetical protein